MSQPPSLLKDQFKEELTQSFKENSRPCKRCGSKDHGTAKCKASFDNSWKFDDCWTDETEPRAIKNVAKKIQKIEDLEKQRDGGKKLEKNQLESMKSKSMHMKEKDGLESDKRKQAEEFYNSLNKIQQPSLGLIDSNNTAKFLPKNEPETTKEGVLRANQVSTESTQNPTGPEFKIMTNYVKIRKVPKNLHVYSLRFWRPHPKDQSKEIDFNKKKDLVSAFQALIDSGHLGLGPEDTNWATNFKDLWCSSELNLPFYDDGKAKCKRHITPAFTYMQINGRKIDDLKVTLTKDNDAGVMDDIHKALLQGHVADVDAQIRALNAFVAQAARINDHDKSLLQIGANKFYLKYGYKDMNPLLARRGYSYSVRPTKEGPLLNVNTATTAFLPAMDVSQLLTKFDQREVEKMLSDAAVRVKYTRKIHDDSFDPNTNVARCKQFKQFGKLAREQMFYVDENDHKGRTVEDYMVKECNIKMSNFRQEQMRCVNVGKRVDTSKNDKHQSLNGAKWIPAGLLEIVEFQPMKSMLSGGQTATMIKCALRLPAHNADLISKEGLSVLGIRKGQNHEKSDELLIDDKLITLPAKTLPFFQLFFLDKKTGKEIGVKVHAERGSWNFLNVRLASPKSINRLHVLGLSECWGKQSGNGGKVLCTRFRKELSDALTTHKIHFDTKTDDEDEEGACIEMQQRDLDEEIKDWFSHCWKDDLTVMLLPEKNSINNYAEIKRAGDLVAGQHTLCAIASKSTKQKPGNRLGYFANLALKVNLKAGGDNWFPDQKRLTELLGSKKGRESTLILGADVTHPGMGSRPGAPSIACVVGTVDDCFMRYLGSMRLQAGTKEVIDQSHLRSMIKERIQDFRPYKDRKILPTQIIFYRDGVSESQFRSCENEEIPQIEAAYKELGGDSENLRVYFIVVGKRHNTRFYPTETKQSYTDGKENRINGNLKPGLLVEKVVTNAKPQNFFLQSHCAIKGTARSAHYHVLKEPEDEAKRLDIPPLSLMLCCTFGRATTSVSYAAPAYIADRLCERGRVYMRQWNENPTMNPIFTMPKDTTKQGVMDWKADCAKKLALTPNVWGPNYNKIMPDGRTRLNPWHRNLDSSTFWM